MKYNSDTANVSAVFKGMITLLIGSGLARVIGVLAIPILTRLYTPSDYGNLALYTSLIAIIAPVLTLRYSQALPLPKSNALSFNLFLLCVLLIIGGATLITLILGFFREQVFSFFSIEALAPWWLLIVIGLVGTSLYEILVLWATRKKKYKLIAKSEFTQSLTGNSIKVILGLIHLSSFGLLLGQLFNQITGITSLVRSLYVDYKKVKSKVNVKRIIFMGKYYRGFVFYRLPSQIMLTLSVQAPILMAASLYNTEVTGQLGLAFMALSLPLTIIGQSVSRAFYAEVAALGRKNIFRIKKITSEVQKKLFFVGIPCTILIMLCAKPLFQFFFGDAWSLSGEFAAILSPFILMQFTSGPIMQVLNLLSSQILYLVINTVRVAGLAFIYFIFIGSDYEPKMFVTILSLYLFIFYCIITLIINVILRKKAEESI